MNDEQKDRDKQLALSLGAREFVRFGCAFVLWLLLGTALATWLGTAVIQVAFLLAPFVYAFVATRWGPGYWLLRRIAGNENMPRRPLPSAARIPKPSRPWWSYLPGVWFWLLTILVFIWRSGTWPGRRTANRLPP